MIKEVNGRFGYYSILPKIRHILLHWVYGLTKNDLLWFFNYFCSYKKRVIIGLIGKNY